MNDTYLLSGGFDFFVGAMICIHCGQRSPADESTNMQTYLRDAAQFELLGIGKYLADNLHDMEEKRYITIQPARHTATLIDSWNCPYCGWQNWALISIKDDEITNITAIELNRENLLQANYVTTDVSHLAVDLSGLPFRDVMKEGPAQVLLRFLE